MGSNSWLCVLNSLSLHLPIHQMGTMKHLAHRVTVRIKEDKLWETFRCLPLKRLLGLLASPPQPPPQPALYRHSARGDDHFLPTCSALSSPHAVSSAWSTPPPSRSADPHSYLKEGTSSRAFLSSLSGRASLPLSCSPTVSTLERFPGRITGMWDLKIVLCPDHMTLHETLLPPKLVWPHLRNGVENQVLVLCSCTSCEPQR